MYIKKTNFPQVFESIGSDWRSTSCATSIQWNKIAAPELVLCGKKCEVGLEEIVDFPLYLKKVAGRKTNKDGSMLILDELEDRKHMKPEWESPYAAKMIQYMRHCDVTYVCSGVPRSLLWFLLSLLSNIQKDGEISEHVYWWQTIRICKKRQSKPAAGEICIKVLSYLSLS